VKSICIKTNHQKSIEYLLENLSNLNLDNVYFSSKKFKIYQNIIIHFKGKNEKIFLQEISKILALLVIDLFEENIIKKIVSSEYFYFEPIERKQISDNTLDDLYNSEESVYPRDKSLDLLCNDFYEYFKSNKSIVLSGFITFRIKNYIEILVDQVDKSVNKFLIEREYTEFITLLRMYINTEPSSCDIIHLVYYNSEPILLDKDKKVIKVEENLFNAKYLSDITFSSNDYALNTLLTLIPKKIYVHLIDNTVDEFITTLKLIFENRVIYCTDCAICQMYKKSHALI
jgi:putative sporulation protein YtxC